MLSIGCLNDNCILACYDDFFIHKMSVRIYRYCFADPAGRRSGGQFITEAFQRFRRRLGGDYFCLGICRHVRGIVAAPYSGAHLNPALSIGLALAHTFPWAYVPAYIIAQLAGGFLGAVLVYVFYKDHYDATEDPDVKLGTFCTMPAIRNIPRNLICEVIGTFVLVFVILCLAIDGNTPEVGLGSVGLFPVTFLIVAIGMSLGGATGYAINPARDLPPRFAHFVLPIRGKGSSGWGYSWVPVLGPILGACLAAGCYKIIFP